MKKEQSINKFVKGIQMDLNPLTIMSDTLTDCLNGTCLTYNGNERVLQNDMGNARVETAMLPTGYIPLGSTSFGGIIYILSHNPLEGKYQLGSFPSPERNLTKDELDNTDSVIDLQFNQDLESSEEISGINNNITSNLHQLILCKEEINSGDKFKVYSKELLNYLEKNIISGFDTNNEQFNSNLYPKYIRIDLISVLSNGSIVKLTEGLTWTKFKFETETDTGTKTSNGNFYIYPDKITNDGGKVSLKEYRNMINSQYDVYTNKIPGKLGVMLTYEAPNTFDISYDIIPPEKYGIKDFKFSGIHGNGSHTLFENLNLEEGEKIKIVINKHQYTDIDQGYIYIRLSKNDHSNFDDSREFSLFGSPNTEQTELVLNNFIPQQSSAISVTIVKDINSLYSSINTLPDDSIVSIGNIYYIIVSDEGGKKPIQIDKINRTQIQDKIKDGTINSGDYIEIVDDIGDGEIQTGIYQITYEKGDDPNVVKYELVNVVAGSKVPSYGNTSGNEGNEGNEGDGEEGNPEEDNTITKGEKWEQEIIVPETCSNARLIVGYTKIPEGTELHLVNVQIIKYSAKMYYYLNWSNENIGEHKNRVNFQGINIDEQFYPIINKTSAKEQEKEYISPDARENLNYYAPKFPEDYNQLNFDIVKYLNKWNDIESIKYNKDLFSDTYRKNDGTDYQIVVKGNHLTYDLEKIESEKEEAIRELSITPYMPYGKLTYLTKNISIDVTKIGSDTIDMTMFRYYKDDEKINLNLWLDSYLDTNNRIAGIEFKLYKFRTSDDFLKASESSGNKINYDIYKDNLSFRSFNELPLAYEYKLTQQSYNGNINHKIYFDNKFEAGYIYQLEIIINLSKDNQCVYFHRILHASNIFNDKYNSEIADFKDLYLCTTDNFNDVVDYSIDEQKFTSAIKSESYDDIKAYQEDDEPFKYHSTHTIEHDYSNIDISDIEFKLKDSIYNVDKNENTELSPKAELNNNNYAVDINENKVTIDYLAEYTHSKNVSIYELSKIKLPELEQIGDSNSYKSKCWLGFYGTRQNGGGLKLYLDGSEQGVIVHVADGSSDNPTRVYYDLKSNGELHDKLIDYMNNQGLDILPIDIGLDNMKNCDWGFRIRWFKDPSAPSNQGNKYNDGRGDIKYERFLYIRSSDPSTKGYFIGTMKTDEPPTEGDFRKILSPATNYTEGYTYNDFNCFKKYQTVKDSSGENITILLYGLNTISYPKARNPIIKCNLDITLTNDSNILKDLNSSIKNLSFDKISKLVFTLSNYVQIKNQEKINNMLNIGGNNVVVDKDHKEIKDLAKVEMTETINERFNAKLNDDGYLTISSKDMYSNSSNDEKSYSFKMQIRYENYGDEDINKWDENRGQILELQNFKFYDYKSGT